MERKLNSFWSLSGSWFALAVSLFFLAEATQADVFLIEISGFPLSVGRIIYVLIGLYYLGRYSFEVPRLLYGLYIVAIGSFLGAFFSGDVGGNISRASANILLLTATIGMAKFWRTKHAIQLLTIFFVFTYIYWAVYILTITVVGGAIVSYGSVYDQTLFVNHHIMGLQLSLATIYILFRFFYGKRIRFIGYLFIVLSLIILVLTESRSNFIITMIVCGYILYSSLKGSFGTLILTGLFVVIFVYAISYVFLLNPDVNRRFDTSDKEYITQSSASRVELARAATETFMDNPLGKGLSDTRVGYRGFQFQAHNLYLTFLISSGFLGLVGVILWISGFLKISLTQIRSSNRTIKALNFICIAYMLTIVSNDNYGLLFFLVISWQIHLYEFSRLERYFPAVYSTFNNRAKSKR